MLVEFGGSVIIAVACLRGLWIVATLYDAHDAILSGRLILADGVIAALGFKTAATLLRTIELQSWTAIGMVAAV